MTCSSPTRNDSHVAFEEGVANSILVKVNQIGTLTETLQAMQMAAAAGYTSMCFAPLGRNRRHLHR